MRSLRQIMLFCFHSRHLENIKCLLVQLELIYLIKGKRAYLMPLGHTTYNSTDVVSNQLNDLFSCPNYCLALHAIPSVFFFALFFAHNEYSLRLFISVLKIFVAAIGKAGWIQEQDRVRERVRVNERTVMYNEKPVEMPCQR